MRGGHVLLSAATLAFCASCFGGVFGSDYRTCEADIDCRNGERCLATHGGNVCVDTPGSACTAAPDRCPAGTQCAPDGVCRTTCNVTGGLSCVVGQVCSGTTCVGSDPRHDPLAGAAGGGSGGTGTAGSGGAGMGGSGGTVGMPCSSNAVCTGASTCFNSKCVATCTSNPQCADPLACEPFASQDGPMAFGCISASDIPIGGTCKKSSQCVAGATCASAGWCSKACASNADCGNFAWCGKNASGYECYPRCASIGECALYGPSFSCVMGTSISGTTIQVCN